MKQFIENIRELINHPTSIFFVFSLIVIGLAVTFGVVGLLTSLFGVWGLMGLGIIPLVRIVYAGVTGK